MIIFKWLLKFVVWTACLCLRCASWSASRLHQKLRSGPQARLWAASDEEIMVEAKKRGLIKKKKKAKHSENVVPLNREFEDAVLAIKTLQSVSAAVARSAAVQAMQDMARDGRPQPKTQDIVQAAIKYA